MKRVGVTLWGAVAYLALATTAGAQSPVEGGYGGGGGDVVGGVEGTGTGGGALPFTGADLVMLLVVALVLVAAGLMVRRVARAKNTV
jgi:hypothetical protein